MDHQDNNSFQVKPAFTKIQIDRHIHLALFCWMGSLALNLFYSNTNRPTFKPRYIQFKGTRSALHQTVFVINVLTLLFDDIVQFRTSSTNVQT